MACNVGRQHVCCTKIQNLGVKIGNETILSDINLHLHCGELTAIIGRNGAGKSTFMKALLNVVPHTGSITFEGERCSSNCNKSQSCSHSLFYKCLKKERFFTTNPRFGYVPQSLSVEPGSPISVEDLMLSCVTKRPVWLPHRQKDKELVKKMLSATNASHLANKCVSDLSGGELQRVMLSLAINPVPDILLLDEPVSGVDRVGLQDFYKLVSSLRRDFDVTVLLISHDLDLVSQHADRVVFINDSSAVVGSVRDVYRRNDFIEVFGHIMLPEEYEVRSKNKSLQSFQSSKNFKPLEEQ